MFKLVSKAQMEAAMWALDVLIVTLQNLDLLSREEIEADLAEIYDVLSIHGMEDTWLCQGLGNIHDMFVEKDQPVRIALHGAKLLHCVAADVRTAARLRPVKTFTGYEVDFVR